MTRVRARRAITKLRVIECSPVNKGAAGEGMTGTLDIKCHSCAGKSATKENAAARREFVRFIRLRARQLNPSSQ